MHPWHIKRGLKAARKSSAERALLELASDDVREVVGEGFKDIRPPPNAASDAEVKHTIKETRQAALQTTRMERRRL